MEAGAASEATFRVGPAWAVILERLWKWARQTAKARRTRRLRVCETLSLGERRFVAVIEFDRHEYLVGGSGNSFALLARLEEGRVIAEPATLPGTRPHEDR